MTKKNKLAKKSHNKAPSKNSHSTKELITQSTSTFAGPIPPPGVLLDYDAVLPGLADRIVTIAESQAKHRLSLEKSITDAEVDKSRHQFELFKRGQLFGFTLGAIVILCGTYTALGGYPWAGGLFGASGLSAIIASFMISSKN